MTNLAIIPARGGSKRIPRKNIKPFLGKPIIAYSIEAAINSGLFDEVMVSTDDIEIAKIAKKYGAKVPFLRSHKNASDLATTFDVIEEVLLWYKGQDILINHACCIYATAPFVTTNVLNRAQQSLIKNQFDCVFPVVKFGFPIQRAIKLESKQGKMKMFYPEYLNSRSQDLKESYHDVGQFYFFNSDKVLNKKKVWTDNTGVVEVSELSSQDIDNEVDWCLAELKYKLLHGENDSI